MFPLLISLSIIVTLLWYDFARKKLLIDTVLKRRHATATQKRDLIFRTQMIHPQVTIAM